MGYITLGPIGFKSILGRTDINKVVVIHPDNRAKEVWDLWLVALTLFIAIELPLRLVYDYPLAPWLQWMDGVILVSFILDIPLNFMTGHYRGLNLITDRRAIARHYLSSWFIVDLLAAFPFFLFTGSTGANRAIRLVRILELNRLLKLTRLARLAREWQRHHMINPSAFRLLFFIFFISLTAHWIACMWLHLNGIDGAGGLSNSESYSLAIYWTITTLTTVGYGDITPETVEQRYFTIMVMIAGVGSYGYLIGNIAGFLSNMDIVKANYKQKLDEVNGLLHYRAVPHALRKRVVDYYEHLWESRLGHNEFDLLNELPNSLRTDLAVFFRRDLLRKVPFFREADEKLIRHIVMLLKPIVFTPNSVIMRKGQPADCLYIISSGEVEITGDTGDVFATLPEGSFVGEMALVLDGPRTATVRTKGYCDLYILEKSDFQTTLAAFPAFADHVRRITQERQQEQSQRRDRQ